MFSWRITCKKNIFLLLLLFGGKVISQDKAYFQTKIVLLFYLFLHEKKKWGWSGGAKVLCILHHRGVQLILTYSWARPAVLVVGKGRGGMFFISSVSSLSFLFLFLPCPSLSSPLLSLLSLFSLSLGDDTKWPSRVDVSLNPNTIKNLHENICYEVVSRSTFRMSF